MLYSIRDVEQVMPVPKHEVILGLNNAQARSSKKTHTFGTEDEALKAIQSGSVSLSDNVEFG